MSANFINQKRKQYKLVIIAIVMFLVAGVVLWFGYFKDKIGNSSETTIEQPTQNISVPTIDFSIFENSLLKELKPFSKIPSYEGVIGKINPFLTITEK